MKRNIIFICVLGGIVLSVAAISWAEKIEKGKDPTSQPSQADIEKLKKDAEAGDAEAQFNLGRCYGNGQGVKQDDREVYWFSRNWTNHFYN